MRTSARIAFLGFITAAATLGVFAGVSRADHVICPADPAEESCLDHTLTLPIVANDDFFVPVEQLYVNGGCVSRPVPTTPDFFTMAGFEVVTAPENFFYSHAFTMFNSEPFTHTGMLDALLDGPGGPYAAAGDLLNGEAVLNFGLLEGPGTYTVTLPGNTVPIHPGSSITEFDVPGDCLPIEDAINTSEFVFDPTVPGGLLRTVATGTATISNGTCESFETELTFTFFRDGTATSLQADTNDFNEGFFWPGPPIGDYGPEVGDDWFNVYVQDPKEPEAYLGVVSPDLTRIVGRTAWKNCLWDFELLIIGLVSESE